MTTAAIRLPTDTSNQPGVPSDDTQAITELKVKKAISKTTSNRNRSWVLIANPDRAPRNPDQCAWLAPTPNT